MPSDDQIANVTFDELQIGQQAELSRTLRMEDIKSFAAVSGDVNPAHVDPEYADASRFKGVIGHGMWAGALISSVLGTDFPGPGTIYLAQSLEFHRPARVGDTLRVQVVVTDKDKTTANVRLNCEVRNQRDELVVCGQALVRAPTAKVMRPRATLPTLHLFDPSARLQAWLASLAGSHPALKCAVVHPCDEPSLRAALDATARGLIEPVLVGPAKRLHSLAEAAGLELDASLVRDTPHSHAAAASAASMAARGEVNLMMKGSLHTDELMQAVLAESALRTGRRMSHVFRFEVPAYPKPLLVSDAAVHIAPTLLEKADIVQNAIDLAHALGVVQPHVALLSAIETVTPRLQSTLDAAALCKMADRGQIVGGVLDGPLAFDNAISQAAAAAQGITSAVSGCADVLIVPDLEAGNMLAKQLEYLAGAAGCGGVVGARVPVALTSRAEGVLSRVASVALAMVAARAGIPNKARA